MANEEVGEEVNQNNNGNDAEQAEELPPPPPTLEEIMDHQTRLMETLARRSENGNGQGKMAPPTKYQPTMQYRSPGPNSLQPTPTYRSYNTGIQPKNENNATSGQTCFGCQKPAHRIANAHTSTDQQPLLPHNPQEITGLQPPELDALDLRILDNRRGTLRLLGKAESVT